MVVRTIVVISIAGCTFHHGTFASDSAVECDPRCLLGCDATRTSCLQLVPANQIDPAWLTEGTAVLDASADLLIDTDNGTITPTPLIGITYHQVVGGDCGGGTDSAIGVFGFAQITIHEGVTVSAIGRRALGLLASGPIQIDGVIDVGGGLGCADPPRCAGAGGFAGGLYDKLAPQVGAGPGGGGHGYSNNGSGNESGGGGGAACGGGGNGGDDGSGNYPPGLGGTGYLADTLVPLCGGSGGGAGGPASFSASSDPGSRGGGGGGAVQIVSVTSVTIGPSSTKPAGITAAGAGGQGDHASTYDDGGGGGGAGGSILIQAPSIVIAAGSVLAANGGGGGGGYNNDAISTDGARGTLSAVAASGGPGVRRGGNGGAADVVRGEDAPGPLGDGGAGGGGGVGRIRLETRAGTAMLAGVISPSAGACTTQGAVATR